MSGISAAVPPQAVLEELQNPDPGIGGDYFSVPEDLSLYQSKYDFSYRTFPMDLGEQSYNGHYMVININVQNGTRFSESVQGGGNATTAGGFFNTFTRLDNELSKVDALKFNIDKMWKTKQGGSLNTLGIIPRQTRRIVESIALYMPNTVAFDTNNDYEDVGLTSIGSGVSSLLQSASGFIPGVGKQISKAIDLGSDAISGAAGAGKFVQRPINPRVEVLFRNTLQRTFQFDFLFAPEDPRESAAMKQIIKTLRFHAAPEYQNGTASFMYIPPSEFDITFFNRGVENTNIPRINTCALTKILVDYAPQGVYATFGNGHPVSCRMQLEFRELEVVSKLRILQGF